MKNDPVPEKKTKQYDIIAFDKCFIEYDVQGIFCKFLFGFSSVLTILIL